MIALCWPRPRTAGPAWEVRFAVAILLGLLVDPHFLLHDALIALLPGFLLWRAAANGRGVRAVLAAGPGVAFLTEFWNPPAIQLGAWYLVLLLGAVGWAWRDLAESDPA